MNAPEDKRFRVSEIFGPTIQGEGRRAGVPCHFIRFGGCDYRCKWCDSPHAVLPELVNTLHQLTPLEIWNQVRALPKGPEWVVISGGNPALFDLRALMGYLIGDGYSVMTETQGTVYSEWLLSVDDLCISPKPPSSGNETPEEVLREFLSNLNNGYGGWMSSNPYLKVVVFSDADYAYARRMHNTFRNLPFFISVGTWHPEMPTVSNPFPDTMGGPSRSEMRDKVSTDFRLLAEKVASDRLMRDVRILPQLHVLAWGCDRGH